LRFSADGSAIYAGTDGGIYHQAIGSANWDYLSNGLQNTQVYRIAVSEGDSNIIMYGAQDNDVVVDHAGVCDGTNLFADGFGCIIDPTSSSILFGEYQYGGINQSLDGGNTWSQVNVGSGNAGWNAPYKMNPLNHLELFAGLDVFYHSTDGGNTWTALGGLGGASYNYITEFAFAETNTQVVYSIGFDYTQYLGLLYKSTDGGNTWLPIVAPALAALNISNVEVNDRDPNEVWITAGGYLVAKKVFHSTDGGTTWANISGTLPDLPARCITYQKNSPGVLYVGMDNGVYVISDSLTDWLPYYTGLPNAIVKEIKVRYSTNDVFVGTYGRGVWHSKAYSHTNLVSGIADIAPMQFSVFPNPVGDRLTILASAEPHDAVIKILDEAGQTVKQFAMNKGEISISCDGIAPGLYLVSMESEGRRIIRKFIKM
jgi:hypothetical protein